MVKKLILTLLIAGAAQAEGKHIVKQQGDNLESIVGFSTKDLANIVISSYDYSFSFEGKAAPVHVIGEPDNSKDAVWFSVNTCNAGSTFICFNDKDKCLKEILCEN